MSGEPENFEQLRRLLALKRYEQPPPGYFDHFSRGVIFRIRSGEVGGRGQDEPFSWNYPWLRKISALLEIRPALAGAFGVAVCGFLVMASVYTEPVGSSAESGLFAGPGLAVVPAEHSAQLGSRPLLPMNGSLSGLGTRGLPFESPLLESPRIQPVMYTAPR